MNSDMGKNDVNFRVTADKLCVGDICYVVGDEGIRTVTVKRIQTYDNGKEFTITYNDGCVGSARPNDKETGYGMYAARVYFNLDDAVCSVEDEIERRRKMLDKFKSDMHKYDFINLEARTKYGDDAKNSERKEGFVAGALRMREILMKRTHDWIFHYISDYPNDSDDRCMAELYEDYDRFIRDREKADYDIATGKIQ